MKGREDMFKLLQNEYEEYREYFKELELIQRQYNQEEAYYFIINKLIRDSIDDKDISVRDVHKVRTLRGENANKLSGRNKYLKGYDGQAPDFVILNNDFDESKGEDQSDRVYGCVEIKPFSKSKGKKDNRKLYSEYIFPINEPLNNKELVKVVNVDWYHEKLYHCNEGEIKIEFESKEGEKKFIENHFKEGNKPIPISLENGDIKGKVFLCGGNQKLCLQIEEKQSKESEESKIQLEIQKRNDKGVLILQDSKNEYPVELEKTNELFFLKEKVFDNKKVFNNKTVFDNETVCELLKELVGFKKVIFTNGYQWILMQCKEVEYSETNFEKVKDRNEIKVTSLIMVKGFQCESLANFYPEPKDEETFINLKKMEQCQDMSDMSEKLDAEKQKLKIPLTEFQTDEDFKAWTAMTFAELQQHNFKQWLHLKFEINRIFKEAKSQNKQGEEKIGHDE